MSKKVDFAELAGSQSTEFLESLEEIDEDESGFSTLGQFPHVKLTPGQEEFFKEINSLIKEGL